MLFGRIIALRESLFLITKLAKTCRKKVRGMKQNKIVEDRLYTSAKMFSSNQMSIQPHLCLTGLLMIIVYQAHVGTIR